MRMSRFFLPTLRETPKEAEIVSHRLALRAGLVRQESAGIYAWLPLGLRVLNNVCRIIREEQNRSGAIELNLISYEDGYTQSRRVGRDIACY